MLLLILFVMSLFYIPTAKEASLSAPLNVGNVYRSTSPPQSSAWIGSAIIAGASLLGGLFGNRQQNKNINKQIQAQQEENQKNREYNLMLAQQQNAWNVEQWERENEYNSPEKQMERYKKAGLNPDIMAGGAQNLSAASPAMTAGAASTATDMSMLGQKPTLGQAIQTALRDSMLGAQIDNIKAQTRKTEAEAGLSEIDAKYRDAEKTLGIELGTQELRRNAEEITLLSTEWRQKALQNEGLSYDVYMKKVEHTFKERQMEALVKKLENEAKLSSNEVEYALKSLSLRLTGLQADTDMKVYGASMRALLEDGPAKTALQALRYIRDSIF